MLPYSLRHLFSGIMTVLWLGISSSESAPTLTATVLESQGLTNETIISQDPHFISPVSYPSISQSDNQAQTDSSINFIDVSSMKNMDLETGGFSATDNLTRGSREIAESVDKVQDLGQTENRAKPNITLMIPGLRNTMELDEIVPINVAADNLTRDSRGIVEKIQNFGNTLESKIIEGTQGRSQIYTKIDKAMNKLGSKLQNMMVNMQSKFETKGSELINKMDKIVTKVGSKVTKALPKLTKTNETDEDLKKLDDIPHNSSVASEKSVMKRDSDNFIIFAEEPFDIDIYSSRQYDEEKSHNDGLKSSDEFLNSYDGPDLDALFGDSSLDFALRDITNSENSNEVIPLLETGNTEPNSVKINRDNDFSDVLTLNANQALLNQLPFLNIEETPIQNEVKDDTDEEYKIQQIMDDYVSSQDKLNHDLWANGVDGLISDDDNSTPANKVIVDDVKYRQNQMIEISEIPAEVIKKEPEIEP